MKTTRMSLGASIAFKPAHPDRTASRALPGAFGDVEFKTWPARTSMARSVRMQERREPRNGDWCPCVKLADGEGF